MARAISQKKLGRLQTIPIGILAADFVYQFYMLFSLLVSGIDRDD